MSVVSKTPFVSRARFAALCLTTAIALSACGTMSETQVHGVVLSDDVLAQIKPGTPQSVVLDNLGTPSTTSTLNGEAFYYVSQTTTRPVQFMAQQVTDRHVLAVYFDDKQKVTHIANYGLKDGAVFDFISRTTPTAGGELNFLTQLERGLLHGLPGISQ